MNRKKFLPVAIIFGGVISIFALWNFFCVPIQSETLRMQLETKKLRTIEQEIKTLQNRYGDFYEFVELNGDRLSELEKLLPPNPTQEKFSSEIYKTAAKNQLAVTSLQVGELISVDESNLQQQSIKIKLKGKYIPILNFVREIEDGERFAKLENISLETDANNLISCDVEFLIFNADFSR